MTSTNMLYEAKCFRCCTHTHTHKISGWDMVRLKGPFRSQTWMTWHNPEDSPDSWQSWWIKIQINYTKFSKKNSWNLTFLKSFVKSTTSFPPLVSFVAKPPNNVQTQQKKQIHVPPPEKKEPFFCAETRHIFRHVLCLGAIIPKEGTHLRFEDGVALPLQFPWF